MSPCTCGRRGTHESWCPVNRPVTSNRPSTYVCGCKLPCQCKDKVAMNEPGGRCRFCRAGKHILPDRTGKMHRQTMREYRKQRSRNNRRGETKPQSPKAEGQRRKKKQREPKIRGFQQGSHGQEPEGLFGPGCLIGALLMLPIIALKTCATVMRLVIRNIL